MDGVHPEYITATHKFTLIRTAVVMKPGHTWNQWAVLSRLEGPPRDHALSVNDLGGVWYQKYFCNIFTVPTLFKVKIQNASSSIHMPGSKIHSSHDDLPGLLEECYQHCPELADLLMKEFL